MKLRCSESIILYLIYMTSANKGQLEIMNSGRLSSRRHNCKMPRKQGEAGVAILEKKDYIPAPAIIRRGRRFLNLTTLFHSKLHASTTDHRRITLTQGITQHCDEKKSGAKLSRFLRVMGRFWGTKNRVREEISKHLDKRKTPDGYNSVTHLQGEKCHQPALKKKAEDQDQSSCDQRKQGRCADVTRFELPYEPQKEAPRKGRDINKWVVCEGTRDEQRDARSHFELVKPVLEPMPVFLTLDLEQGQELGYLHSPILAELQNNRQSDLFFLPERLGSIDDLAEEIRMIRECKNMVTQLGCKEGTEQGAVVPEASFFVKNHATMMATPGAISPLVAMLDSSSSTFCTHSAIAALLSLAAGSDLNNPNSERNLLACFTLDRNRSLIGASGAIPPLMYILKIGRDPQIQNKALELLYNLSLNKCNVKTLVRTGATSVILNLVNNPRHSEKALAVLATVVAIPLGRKATMNLKDGVEVLVRVIAWDANPKCQESAVHLLMMMAPHSYSFRQAMVRKRAIPALLELSLLGSAVAQKRAVCVLGFLRDDREQGRAA